MLRSFAASLPRALAVGVVLGSGPALAATDDALSDVARRQIQSLLAEKDARTPAQAKIDSNLLHAIRQAEGRPIAEGIAGGNPQLLVQRAVRRPRGCALAVNVTVTSPGAAGFVTLHPADQSAPLASVIHFSPGQPAPKTRSSRPRRTEMQLFPSATAPPGRSS